jgi:hypothetical protein
MPMNLAICVFLHRRTKISYPIVPFVLAKS